MDLGLRDRVVVITGGAAGIGLAASRALIDHGARVTVLDRDADALEALARERPGTVTKLADVADAEQVAAAHDEVIAATGRIDVAINNAGISRPFGRFHEVSVDDWDSILGVNLKGMWLCMREQLRQMSDQGSGVVVNTASVAGLMGAPGAAAYTASKHGVIGLTRTAALEYAPQGIRVNAVAPGTVDTPMSERTSARKSEDPYPHALIRQGHPLRPLALATEVADAILFLSSDRSSFATGSVLVLDGGMTAQ